eukprot:m.63923 g.63923  ORF g.63923 m.63923 type:complete len:57 (-) comp23363_c0_seq1:1975-2145(-)
MFVDYHSVSYIHAELTFTVIVIECVHAKSTLSNVNLLARSALQHFCATYPTAKSSQ